MAPDPLQLLTENWLDHFKIPSYGPVLHPREVYIFYIHPPNLISTFSDTVYCAICDIYALYSL